VRLSDTPAIGPSTRLRKRKLPHPRRIDGSLRVPIEDLSLFKKSGAGGLGPPGFGKTSSRALTNRLFAGIMLT